MWDEGRSHVGGVVMRGGVMWEEESTMYSHMCTHVFRVQQLEQQLFEKDEIMKTMEEKLQQQEGLEKIKVWPGTQRSAMQFVM